MDGKPGKTPELYISKHLSFDVTATQADLDLIISKSKIWKSKSFSTRQALWHWKMKESHQDRKGLYKALDVVKEYYILETTVLTVDFLNELHRKVLFFDFERRGYLRKAPEDLVATHNGASLFHYPPPIDISGKLTYICDIVNTILFDWTIRFTICGNLTTEGVLLYVKLCAWTFHQLVSLHGYLDGNGRVARLVLAHLLTVIAPFPVALMSESRHDYIDAVCEPRRNLTGNPKTLADMIFTSMLDGFNNL
jgi:hypothetical protein